MTRNASSYQLPVRPGSGENEGQGAIRATGLHKVYGQGEAAVAALNGVDVRFERGGFTAIMGLPAPASRP